MKNLIKSITVFLLLNLVGANILNGQDVPQLESKLVKEKTTFSINLGGTTTGLGVTLEHVIENRVGLEAGAGFWLFGAGAGLGAVIYPIKPTTIGAANFYFGIKHSRAVNSTGLFETHSDLTYFPLGLSFFTDSRISLSIDLGPSRVKAGIGSAAFGVDRNREKESLKKAVMGSFKVGYRF